jgi:hypothetical protein
MDDDVRVTFRVCCAHCGTVRVRRWGIARVIDARGGPLSYRFTCPRCDLVAYRDASPEHNLVLLAAGVAADRQEAPSPELPEARPLGEDEVGRLIAVLADDDALAAAVATLHTTRGHAR